MPPGGVSMTILFKHSSLFCHQRVVINRKWNGAGTIQFAGRITRTTTYTKFHYCTS